MTFRSETEAWDAYAATVSELVSETPEIRNAFLAGFRVAPEPVYEYGVLFPEVREEASFVGIEDSARYFMGRPAKSLDKYAEETDERVLVRRVKAGPWLPVVSTSKEQGDD